MGTIAAGLVLGYLLSLASWRAVFIVSAAATAAVIAALVGVLAKFVPLLVIMKAWFTEPQNPSNY